VYGGFRDLRVAVPTGAGTVAAWAGGEGPPLLLLHGYPQTRAMWHLVAPALVQAGHSVVIPDLRGYGQTGGPPPSEDGGTHSKREMAADALALMRELGHGRFAVAGHDRGGRVAHRLALDHPDAVERLAVLDIVPTRTLLLGTDLAFADAYWHWFFLMQRGGLPERMIAADPDWYVREIHRRWAAFPERIHPEALEEYVRRFTGEAIAASCADYRAAAGPDLRHDEADARAGMVVTQPLLVLWGDRGAMGRMYDVLATWREVAPGAAGAALDCGHFPAEEAPRETTSALAAFFAGDPVPGAA
jgi:haloacetate dehalogenase